MALTPESLKDVSTLSFVETSMSVLYLLNRAANASVTEL